MQLAVALNIRQGTAASAAIATLDNLQVATAFADHVVPEPSTVFSMFTLLGSLGFIFSKKAKSAQWNYLEI